MKTYFYRIKSINRKYNFSTIIKAKDLNNAWNKIKKKEII